MKEEIVARRLFGEDAADAAEEVIAEHLDFWRRQEDADYFRGVSAEDVVGRISGEVHEVVNRAALSWGVGGGGVVDNLYEIARHLVAKDCFPPDVFSGLVIAGFGEAEHFPAVLDLQIGGVYGGRLKVRPASLAQVSDENPSHIMAFAYTNMVDAFLHGISPRVRAHVEDATTFVREMPPLALDAVAGLAPAEKAKAAGAVRRASQAKAAEFAEKVLQGTNERSQKIARAVGTLTIGELRRWRPRWWD